MPPKVKVTKEDIINAAVDIVRNSGAQAINARTIATTIPTTSATTSGSAGITLWKVTEILFVCTPLIPIAASVQNTAAITPRTFPKPFKNAPSLPSTFLPIPS